MKDRRKGGRRSFAWDRIYPNHTFYGERRKTIIKAGRRIGVEDRRGMVRTEDNYFRLGNEERRKK